jgi:hypothetical protein
MQQRMYHGAVQQKLKRKRYFVFLLYRGPRRRGTDSALKRQSLFLGKLTNLSYEDMVIDRKFVIRKYANTKDDIKHNFMLEIHGKI